MDPVITLASDPYSRGEDVARLAAEGLGYRLLGDEVFADAAALAETEPSSILDAVREPPGFLGMGLATRKRHLACLGAALTKAVLPGGVVYRGPAGHHFIHGVAHVVRVKVTASVDDRARVRAEATGESPAKARRGLVGNDKRRFRTCQEVFGQDCGDPALYDLLVSTSETPVERAAELVAQTARMRRYQPQTWSIGQMETLALTFRLRASLAKLDPDVLIAVEEGKVKLRTRAAESPEDRLCQSMKEVALAEPGVAGVTVETSEDLFGGRGRLIR